MKLNTRQFLQTCGGMAAGFLGLHAFLRRPTAPNLNDRATWRYGELIADPNGILDLPRGFRYSVISQAGQRMSDGLRVPGRHDGMAAFPGPGGKTILIRNHELNPEHESEGAFGRRHSLLSKIDRSKLYSNGSRNGSALDLGGTTTLVFDTATGRLDRQFLSLAGTQRNCAGGPTPWGSWISCEETTEGSHGYNFEVPAHPNMHLVDPVPLTAMGRFNHEAVAVDPASGIVYQTEDRENGLIYRFIPHQPGQLQQGGRLQALRFLDQPGMDARNWETQIVLPGERFAVDWVDLKDVESPEDELRLQGFYAKGAARFARTEGMWHDRQMVYFACTNGGLSRKGQIWRYYPSPYEGGPGEAVYPGWVELFLEPNDSSLLENADNLTVAPWGDLIVCEDDILQLKPLPGDLLIGITPDGQIYKLARSFISELCGSTFSPDGSTLFVNIYDPGMTLAITGPWRSVPPEPVWI